MKVLIVFYSRWGHITRLAEAIAEGVGQIPGAEALLRRVAETAYYGACAITDPASPNAPTEPDLAVARAHGRRVAGGSGPVALGAGPGLNLAMASLPYVILRALYAA